MNRYLKTDEWNIIEEGFKADRLRISESIFSLGNGRLGERGNLEEPYGSDTYRASFVAGVTYLDKTRVGWWKNGFPRFYTRLPIAANWSRIGVRLMDEELDLATWEVKNFQRRLNMKEGISYREMEVTSPRGSQLKIKVEHLNSMAHPDLCLIRYNVTSGNYKGRISLVPTLDCNPETNKEFPDEKVWNVLRAGADNECAYLWTQTRREDAQVCFAMSWETCKNGQRVQTNPIRIEKERMVGFSLGMEVKPGDSIELRKYVAISTSLYDERQELIELAVGKAKEAEKQGWEKLKKAHSNVWEEIWQESDVRIEGDPEAQQGIRYNIFQLYQTYRGDDPRLNIGPKGFTGEKYGGNTYWNTELCCVPFFHLSTSRHIAENLLLYRYRHLQKAIENARRLGFKGGAALYPQVTSTGEECHAEWEITFEEIHRNNIIAYAIIQHSILTGQHEYTRKYGLEVLIAICRFWSQRVSFSQPKGKYVILGVTGPDEYANNVDNNWYTNYSCQQCLWKTIETMEVIARQYPEDYARIVGVTQLNSETETARWREIADNMYLPEEKERGIFVQNDGYLDKELQTTDTIPPEERPINQHWSWDRILRSCYIKQSDVLLGLYLYYKNFDKETIRRNFDFYEPMTVHESSLSPHVHAILAARIGEVEKAYGHFMHATRLDLDDYNNETHQGLHITSMPGSWLAIANGFGGMQVDDEGLSFEPIIPQKWSSYTFRINFQGSTLSISVRPQEVNVNLLQGEEIDIKLYNKKYRLTKNSPISHLRN